MGALWFHSHAASRSSHLQTSWDQMMVPRSCALGTTASLQPPQTRAALGRDFSPSSLCISDKLRHAGPWGICSSHCLPLHQHMGPGTDEGSCLSQGKRGHRRLKWPSWACAGIFILEHNLTLFSSQNRKLGSNRSRLFPSTNTHTPNLESSLPEQGVKV